MATLSLKTVAQQRLGKTGPLSVNDDVFGYVFRNGGVFGPPLVGKVFCKVDGAIDVGDLLTTSQTPGHAMKATDPQRAFGAVIGKALKSWSGARA